MKKILYSITVALTTATCFYYGSLIGQAANPNPYYTSQTFSYYNMNTQGNTGWLDKYNGTDVYINPTSGPALYYTVQGKGANNAITNRSARLRITNGAQAGVPNTVYQNNEFYARLYMERTTSGQVYTSGTWNPHTI